MTVHTPQPNISKIEEDRQLVHAFLKNPAGQGRLLQSRLQSGIDQGVASALREWDAQIAASEREDLLANSFAKAFAALRKWQGKSTLKTWSHRIAYNTTIDALRKLRNDPLHKATSLDQKAPQEKNTKAACSEEQLRPKAAWREQDPTPEEVLIEGQLKHQLPQVRQIVEAWPEPERSLGQMLLSGQAASISAAAHLLRAETGLAMYPAKARMALQARQHEFAHIEFS